MPTIADILMAQGDMRARREMQRGQQRGQLIAGLSQVPGQMLEDRDQRRMLARKQAMEQDAVQREALFRAAQLGQGQQRIDQDTAQFEAGQAEKAAGTARAAQDEQRARQAVLGWVKQHGAELPQGAAEKMLAVMDMPGGLKVVMENLAKAPDPPKFERVTTRGADGTETTQFVTPTAGQTFTSVPEVKPDTRSLQIQANDALKAGNTAEYQRLLSVIKETGQADDRPQERSGYFTMTPVYDAQGRPVGAMKLNTRTGQTEMVTPDQLGGVTARPPGTLGADSIRNESALDSLARLRAQFESGAKEDIGPGEGRGRRVAQALPGGVRAMKAIGVDPSRFANFEAASRNFENITIKAITGAQMGEREADRILGQVPRVTDDPVVWVAKAAQTEQNLKDIERRMRSDRDATPGGALTPPQSGPDASGDGWTVIDGVRIRQRN